jgi:hypothetical protein
MDQDALPLHKKKEEERGRSRGAREMIFRREGGTQTERDIPVGISVIASACGLSLSGGVWGKYICIAYKRFMNTKECHRRSRCTRLTRHGSRETDVDDHREK